MKVNRVDTFGSENKILTTDIKSLDQKMLDETHQDDSNPVMKLMMADYMSKVLTSDGTDPDNQPDW